MINNLKKLITSGLLSIKLLFNTIITTISKSGRLNKSNTTILLNEAGEALLSIFFNGKKDIGEGVIFKIRPPNCA